MKQIYDALTQLISNKVAKYVDSRLDDATCNSIYREIFDTIVEVFTQAEIKVSNEAVNLVSQMYYDSVQINGNLELNPNIFTQRAKPESVATKELAMLATLFNGTPFAAVFIHTIKRRS